MKRIFLLVATFSLIAISLTIGIMCVDLPSGQEETNRFTYPLSIRNKTYTVTVETNWTEERAPSVNLLNSSYGRYPIELVFLGTTEKNISYNIIIPNDLIWGNISLIRKYYLVNPDSYNLIDNGTHNSLRMTFNYQPFLSGNGYFEILGTEGAW